MKLPQHTLLRLGAFSASTLVGTAVDTAVLWVYAHLWLHGYAGERIVAPSISFVCATLANFTVAYFLVWRDRISKRNRTSFWRHYAGYFCSCTGGFVIKMIFLQIFSVTLRWDVVWCNLLALCFSGLFNFYMNDHFVFRYSKQHAEAAETTPDKKGTPE